MTKYIDLLREHQQQGSDKTNIAKPKKRKGKKKKAKRAPSAAAQNPYSNQGGQQEALTEHADALLEEADETTSVDKKMLVEDGLLIEEEPSKDPTPIVVGEKQNTPSKVSQGKETLLSTTSNKSFEISLWLKQINQVMFSIFESAQEEEPMETSSLNEHLQLLFNQIENSETTLDVLELEINRNVKATFEVDHSVADLVQKSIMMMLYSIKVGLQLKLQYQELLPHTEAAMLHHIGMAMVPDNVRLKASKLSRSELKQVRQAPENAAEYIRSCHIDNQQVLLAISQASERYDGSGTNGLTGHEIAWVARMVGLLSMFEALIHFRSYRQRLLPRDAIRELVNHHKKEFDPVMLKALIESISLYPVGTFVQINTGEIGQVVNIHNKFPLRPIIHINMDRHGHLITERKIDLKQQPNLMIQKCMYEESLEELRLEHEH